MNVDALKLYGSSYYDPYWDYDFDDGDLCKLYSVTFDEESRGWYGIHRSSLTPDGMFDDGVPMTTTDIRACVACIPIPKLPTGYNPTDYLNEET